MKDNNQSANIDQLIEAGVRSFKIEGWYAITIHNEVKTNSLCKYYLIYNVNATATSCKTKILIARVCFQKIKKASSPY